MTNRQSIGEHQNLASFCKHLQKYCGDGISQSMLQKNFSKIFSNFNTLAFIYLEEHFPACGPVAVETIVEILANPKPNEKSQAINALISSPDYQTFLELCREAVANYAMPDDLDDDISEAIKRSLQDS